MEIIPTSHRLIAFSKCLASRSKGINPKFETVPGQGIEISLRNDGFVEPSDQHIDPIPFTFQDIQAVNLKPSGQLIGM